MHLRVQSGTVCVLHLSMDTFQNLVPVINLQGPMPSIAARAESDLNLPLLEQQQRRQSRDASVWQTSFVERFRSFSRTVSHGCWQIELRHRRLWLLAFAKVLKPCPQRGPRSPVELSPLQCLRSADFWMLFTINGICSGAGLTLLNNVGQQVCE